MSTGFDATFQQTLARQSWSLYGVGMFLVALRIYARLHRVGMSGMTADDYLMLVAAGFYTTLIVCLNVIASGGGSNLFLPEEFQHFTEAEIKERIKGSKIVVVSEQAMLNVIYTLKICLLFLYHRITQGTHQRRWVTMLAVYVGVGWTATQVTFFTACRPFSGYWAVPPPDPQCTTLQHYAIVQAAFNLTSDVMMLSITLPMVISLKLPMKQKLVLGLVLSMGLFIVIAAILTKVYNLANVYDTSYMLWYTREASVAVYVANLPLIWPLLREWFPFLRNISSLQKSAYGRHKYGQSTRSGGHQQVHSTINEHRDFPQELSTFKSRSRTIDDASSIGSGYKSHKGFIEAASRREGSLASDDRRLQMTVVEKSRTFWGKGDIKAEVMIEVERESIDIERGSSHGITMGAGYRPERVVRIQGGRSKPVILFNQSVRAE